MDYEIEKVVTALGRVFEVGVMPYTQGVGTFCDAVVTEITAQIGDPAIGLPAGAKVALNDGRTVEVNNVAETWYAA